MAIRLAFRRRSAGRSGPPVGSAAFRTDASAAPTDRPSRRQAAALLSTLVVVAAGIGVASYTVRPETARTFDLVHGSVFLTDQYGPVGIDFATGRPTLRLTGAEKQVGAARAASISLVPVTDGTLMLNPQSGQFNMVDDTGFVIKHDGGGVVLPARRTASSTSAVAADGGTETDVPGAAYLVRTGSGGTDFLLVNRSTVETASTSRIVQPRAQAATTAQAMSGQDAVAGANGDLWVLLGAGTQQHQIRQLSVPVDSDTGAQLTSRPMGTVTGPAAIGTATTNVDGSGGTAVAVAAADRIVYYPSDGSAARTLRLPANTGVRTVLPVSGGRGELAFLLQDANGWALVTLDGDGTRLHGPTRMTGVRSDADLARPAWSGGDLYTVDRAAGHLGRIYHLTVGGRATTVPGAATYPLARQETGLGNAQTPNFSDAYVVSRGSRVLVNSPNHQQAVALFTDTDRKPLIITKGSAVDVSVAGGAEALTKRDIAPTNEHSKTRQGGSQNRRAGRQINTTVDCKKTVQKPNVPAFTGATATANSITASWAYSTLGDTQACYPTTWRLHAHAVSAGATVADQEVPINGPPTGTITGLSPSTTYELTVTAYLYKQQTTSEVPISATTTADDGPSRPTALRVRADSSGNWLLDWNGCGSSTSDCVPPSSWTITATVCDSLGVAAAPSPRFSSPVSSRAQGTYVFKGSTDLLGRGLAFTVVGTDQTGRAGRSVTNDNCVRSWRTPNAAAVTASASKPVAPSADGTTSITASVGFSGSAVAALGGVGGTLTYQLLSGGSVIDSVGPTTDTSVQLDNVAAGRTYSVAVTASPPGHPEIVVPLGTAAVDPAVAPWPAIGLSPTFTGTGAAAGTLTMSFGLGGTSARGEHFDLVNSLLTCGNATYDLNRTDVAIGEHLDWPNISRFDYNGNCNVTVQLRQNDDHSTNPPLFGAGLSGTTTAAVAIAPPDSTTTAADFTARWAGDPGKPAIAITYSGNDPENLMSGWKLAVSSGQLACGSSTGAPPATIDVPPTCIQDGATFSVSVDYSYGSSKPHFDIPVTGTAPRPIDPDNVHFSAAWGGDATNPTVDVTYDGTEDKSELSGADWTETVTSEDAYPGIVCGSSTKNPGYELISVPVDLSKCPPGQVNGEQVTYQVTIRFTDIYGQDVSKTYDVAGDPPS